MKLGIERPERIRPLLKDKRVGLITNHTGVDSTLCSSVDLVKKLGNLTALFAPEHGVRGDKQAGEQIDAYIDLKTGIPVHSLYGKTKKPTPKMLESIEVLCYDIQDVGARFYTYVTTLFYAMQAAADKGIPLVVFDRPNPLSGVHVEGRILDPKCISFVGQPPLVERYGLTIGELAQCFNVERDVGASLHVIPMDGWRRSMWFDETPWSWVAPSPNIPTAETALVYLATCYFEGTNLSEGRGTTRPFKLFGAPWFQTDQMLEALEKEALPGVRFLPVRFTPTFSKHKNQPCAGLEIYVMNKAQFEPVYTGYVLLYLIAKIHREFQYLSPYKVGLRPMIDLLTGQASFGEHTDSLATLKRKLTEDTHQFATMKVRYHLYEP